MAARIGGQFPGGPRRPQEGNAPRTTYVPNVDEIEAAMARRTQVREQDRRRQRVAIGFLLCVFVAGGVGFVVGRSVNEPAPEATAREHRRQRLDKEISVEVNRTLLELWKMEDVQYVRGRNPRR